MLLSFSKRWTFVAPVRRQPGHAVEVSIASEIRLRSSLANPIRMPQPLSPTLPSPIMLIVCQITQIEEATMLWRQVLWSRLAMDR